MCNGISSLFVQLFTVQLNLFGGLTATDAAFSDSVLNCRKGWERIYFSPCHCELTFSTWTVWMPTVWELHFYIWGPIKWLLDKLPISQIIIGTLHKCFGKGCCGGNVNQFLHTYSDIQTHYRRIISVRFAPGAQDACFLMRLNSKLFLANWISIHTDLYWLVDLSRPELF